MGAARNLSQTHNFHSLIRRGANSLADASIEHSAYEAGLLLAHALNLSREQLYLVDGEVTPEQAEAFDRFIARRVEREPVAKIIGRKEFWSLDFETGAATLDPRPDSEALIELLLDLWREERARPLRLLDLGTGTGCLLLAALSEYPGASGLGIERSPGALAVARRNGAALGFAARAEFRAGDWFEGIKETFDVILCNPPYISESEASALMPEVAQYDPAEALYAGAEGLDAYRQLLPLVAEHLRPGGAAIFEIGCGQATPVMALAKAAGLTLARTRDDLGGIARALAFQSNTDQP